MPHIVELVASWVILVGGAGLLVAMFAVLNFYAWAWAWNYVSSFFGFHHALICLATWRLGRSEPGDDRSLRGHLVRELERLSRQQKKLDEHHAAVDWAEAILEVEKLQAERDAWTTLLAERYPLSTRYSAEDCKHSTDLAERRSDAQRDLERARATYERQSSSDRKQ